MGHKSLLQELLKEEQEPFLLNKYISDRRTHMKTTTTTLVNNKQRSTTFPLNLCKNACFSTSTTTTTTTKSPLLELPSPNNNIKPIFLHIPSRTAALLLEAALRIHKHKKTNHGFGLLGSFFRRLKQNRRKHKLKVSSLKDRENVINRSYELGFRCSYSVWSESNDDESLDMETSSSTSTNFDDHHHHHIIHNGGFCESPFRFVLQKSPSSSSGLNTPELPSPPPSSPQTPHTTQDKESNGGESVHKFQSGVEEEDKEQCSPVSVLDPPFEDDDEAHGNDDEDENEEHGFDLECSYAIMQRTKQQLLNKLRRFEKLAGLDPVELEKIMLDQEEEEDETVMEDDGYVYEASEALSCKGNGLIEQVFEALFESSRLQFPEGLKRLVSDVIAEEEREIECLEDYNNRDMVVRRVCKRMELWKQVESNTIDMMIEEDFTREENGWKKKNVDRIRDMAGELELAIFGFLVEEFSEELEC